MLGLDKNKVILVPYSKDWTEEFQAEKKRLHALLGDTALAIEHVGSTAIPGISAKPILDVAVAVKTTDVLKDLIPILSDNGYDVMDAIETKGEIVARKGPPEARTHYVHVEVIDSVFWNNHIVFRDYLLAHPEVVKEYEQLKQKMFEKYKDDRKKYTAAKKQFIQSVLETAQSVKQR